MKCDIVLCGVGGQGILSIATVIATPAEGPSFGVAPSGKCRWMSSCEKASKGMPRRSARLRMYVRAVCTDSRITSPRLPVTWMPPAPGTASASTRSCSRATVGS